MIYFVALVLFFLSGVGVEILPRQMIWGWFFLAAGLCFGGPSIWFWRRGQGPKA